VSTAYPLRVPDADADADADAVALHRRRRALRSDSCESTTRRAMEP
jgi:hypothetical protein